MGPRRIALAVLVSAILVTATAGADFGVSVEGMALGGYGEPLQGNNHYRWGLGWRAGVLLERVAIDAVWNHHFGGMDRGEHQHTSYGGLQVGVEVYRSDQLILRPMLTFETLYEDSEIDGWTCRDGDRYYRCTGADSYRYTSPLYFGLGLTALHRWELLTLGVEAHYGYGMWLCVQCESVSVLGSIGIRLGTVK